MKYLFYNNDWEEKKLNIINKYNNISKANNNHTRKILMITNNNQNILRYKQELNLEYSEAINIYTYQNFIKKEIIKFWPIIISKCSDIKRKALTPIFISNNISEYIINDKVSNKRSMEGYFSDITSTNINISKNIYNNIITSSKNLIEFEDISNKVYLSKKNKNNIDKYSYSEMNEIIIYYINLLLNNGVLDNSLCFYIYNHYLLNDEVYISYLKKEYDYLIIESLESSCNAEVDFINKFNSLNKDIYLYFNQNKDYGVFNNIDINYIKENILDNSNVINECKSIRDIDISDMYMLNTDIKIYEDNQVYNEMVDNCVDKINELINLNYNPKDICIITPINDKALENKIIYKAINKFNINIKNTKNTKKINNNKYVNVILTLINIYYKKEVTSDEYINLIEILFKVNKIKATKIYKDKLNNKELNSIIEEISKCEELNISELIINIYINHILKIEESKNYIQAYKNIMQSSEEFLEIIKILKLDSSKSKEDIIINIIKYNMNDYYNSYHIKDIIESENIIITTPYNYISNNISRPIQIWVDIGSNTWSMKIEKDISNFIVLRKTYNDNEVYEDFMEEYYKKYYLNNTIYNLLKTSKQVHAFKSDYNINGYVQESRLYTILSKLIERDICDEKY